MAFTFFSKSTVFKKHENGGGVPYFGISGRGVCELLVGVTDHGEWGLAAPHKLLQTWRAMKLLESPAVHTLYNYTLCFCWYSASREDEGYFKKLVEQQRAGAELEAAQAAVLDLLPTPEELMGWLHKAIQNGFSVNEKELIDELTRLGRRVPTLVYAMQHSEKTDRENEEKREDQALLETAKGNYWEIKKGDTVTVGRAGGGKDKPDPLLPFGAKLKVTGNRTEEDWDNGPTWDVETEDGKKTWIWEFCIREAIIWQYHKSPVEFKGILKVWKMHRYVRNLKRQGYKVRLSGDTIDVAMSQYLSNKLSDEKFAARPNLESYADLLPVLNKFSTVDKE